MYLESEVYGLLIWSFVVIIVISVSLLAVMYFKTRNKAIFWFGGQTAFLSLAFYWFYRCITNLPNEVNVMHTENQSVLIGLAGVSWAISMLLMLVGIYKLTRK